MNGMWQCQHRGCSTGDIGYPPLERQLTYHETELPWSLGEAGTVTYHMRGNI